MELIQQSQSETEQKSEIETQVETARDLKKQLDSLKKQVKYVEGKLNTEKEKILLHVDSTTASTETTILKCEGGGVRVGPKAKKVVDIDNEALYDVLGPEKYFLLAKVSVGDIRKYLTTKQVQEVLTESNSGPRSLTWYDAESE